MIKLEKPRARKIIQIVTDNSDDWFLHVNYIEKSTGNLLDSSMIIRKDLETWMTSFKGSGWQVTEDTGV